MLLTFRIRDVLSVLRIVNSVRSGFDLVGVHTLLDEQLTDGSGSSLSQVAVVLFRTQITGVTFNDELQRLVLLQDSNSLVDVIVVVTDLRDVLVKVEENLGL